MCKCRNVLLVGLYTKYIRIYNLKQTFIQIKTKKLPFHLFKFVFTAKATTARIKNIYK